MKLTTLFAALALLSGAQVAWAADKSPSLQPAATKAATKETKAVHPAQPIDINSAGKAQLKTIPGVTDELADKIIAGRPYLTKAHLVTHKIMPMTHYLEVKDLVIARQK